MITINKSEIPHDYDYYRTGSKVFYEYYKNNPKVSVKLVWDWYKFIKIITMIKNYFYSILIEKIDIDDIEWFIKSLWLKHGIIQRTPLRDIKKPKWWWKMPKIFRKDFLHSSRSAFSIIDREDYWNKWSTSAKWHRKKILNIKNEWILEIIECKDLDLFLKVYSSLTLKDPNHKWLVEWCEKCFNNKEIVNNLRIYIAKVNWNILAWAIFIDEWVTSEYFTSFYKESWKPYHLWIAIMDIWFSESYKKWIKYCDLDHMRDEKDSELCKWYTKFKESIADYDVYFHDTWVKIF
jgi:hypothetical protein